MGKILGILLVIALVAGGAYYLGTQRAGESITETATTTPQNRTSETGESKEVDPMIVGTWKSTEDSKFTREFSASGTLTDRYQGDDSATETASFVTVDTSIVAVPGIEASVLASTTVIRVDFASGPMFFSINSLTEAELAMTNLSGRGNILTFTKVK